MGTQVGTQALDIGEQAISQAAETLIKSQLDHVDMLEVEVRTDPLKLTQGQIDSLLVRAQGLVVQNDLRTEKLTLETGAVDVSMLKIMAGEFELDEPASAEAKIALTPNDIQAAFNGDFVKQKMRGSKVTLASGETVTTDASNVRFTIPTAGRIAVEADVMLIEKVETHYVAFSASPQLIKGGAGITLEAVEYDEATNGMPELTRSLIDSTQDLLDFRTFDLGDITFQFTQLDVQPGELLFHANANIVSFG
ncbi:MAG: DUF2993 domain-containing protein [Cyanobacteria bacterium J06627_28]